MILRLKIKKLDNYSQMREQSKQFKKEVIPEKIGRVLKYNR